MKVEASASGGRYQQHGQTSPPARTNKLLVAQALAGDTLEK